jgi:hypothetical protein
MEIYIYILNISIYINLLFCLTMSTFVPFHHVMSSLPIVHPHLVGIFKGLLDPHTQYEYVLSHFGSSLEFYDELHIDIVRYLRAQDSPPDDFFITLAVYQVGTENNLKDMDDVLALLNQIMSF